MGVAGAAKQFAGSDVQFNGRGAAASVADIETPRTIPTRILLATSEVKSRMENLVAGSRPGGGQRQAESVVFAPIGQLHAKLPGGVDVPKGTLRR